MSAASPINDDHIKRVAALMKNPDAHFQGVNKYGFDLVRFESEHLLSDLPWGPRRSRKCRSNLCLYQALCRAQSQRKPGDLAMPLSAVAAGQLDAAAHTAHREVEAGQLDIAANTPVPEVSDELGSEGSHLSDTDSEEDSWEFSSETRNAAGTPTQLRAKIRKLLQDTDIKVGEFQKMIGVSSVPYNKFMNRSTRICGQRPRTRRTVLQRVSSSARRSLDPVPSESCARSAALGDSL